MWHRENQRGRGAHGGWSEGMTEHKERRTERAQQDEAQGLNPET